MTRNDLCNVFCSIQFDFFMFFMLAGSEHAVHDGPWWPWEPQHAFSGWHERPWRCARGRTHGRSQGPRFPTDPSQRPNDAPANGQWSHGRSRRPRGADASWHESRNAAKDEVPRSDATQPYDGSRWAQPAGAPPQPDQWSKFKQQCQILHTQPCPRWEPSTASSTRSWGPWGMGRSREPRQPGAA